MFLLREAAVGNIAQMLLSVVIGTIGHVDHGKTLN